MKRSMAVREFIKLLQDDDIIVASGDTMCKEAYQFDRPSLFYFSDDTIAQSAALGMANGTEKRIFVLCTDTILQQDLDFIMQLGLSKKKNIYCVVFYDEQDNSLISGSRSFMGTVFNLGAETFDYTPYFKKLSEVSKVKGHVEVILGPAIILVRTKDNEVKTDYVETDYTGIKGVING